MLLSPIFLALGAVATSVLNAGGRFAAAAVAPIVYNLAIIGARAHPRRRPRASTGLALGVVGGLARAISSSSSGRSRRLGFRYAPRIDAGGPAGAQGARC